jgi:molecular chaperone Hsp33
MSDSTSYVQRFLLDDLDIRGAIVKLDDVWRPSSKTATTPRRARPARRDGRHHHVIGGNLKQPGRLTMQLQGHGPVSLLVVDITETLNLRGYAKASAEAAGKAGIAELLGDGQLLLSLDMPELRHPYQSFVPIDGNTIAEIFEHYLTQSEQQPAALHTACSGRAACLFLQKLPDADKKDPDGWDRITRLAATLRDDELLGLPPTRSSPASSTRKPCASSTPARSPTTGPTTGTRCAPCCAPWAAPSSTRCSPSTARS